MLHLYELRIELGIKRVDMFKPRGKSQNCVALREYLFFQGDVRGHFQSSVPVRAVQRIAGCKAVEEVGDDLGCGGILLLEPCRCQNTLKGEAEGNDGIDGLFTIEFFHGLDVGAHNVPLHVPTLQKALRIAGSPSEEAYKLCKCSLMTFISDNAAQQKAVYAVDGLRFTDVHLLVKRGTLTDDGDFVSLFFKNLREILGADSHC